MEILIYTAFIFLIFLICLNDFLFYRISNIHVACIILIYALGYSTGVINDPYFWKTLNYACIAFSIFFVLNQLNYMGGGDVKLVFALIFWVGSEDLLAYSIVVSFLAITLSVIYVVTGQTIFNCRKIAVNSRFLTPLFKKIITKRQINNYITKNFLKNPIPYGIPLALGAFCVVFFKC